MDSVKESIFEGLNEALQYAQGKIKLKTSTIKISQIQTFSSSDIKHIRESFGFTQASFANILGVSSKTVEAWENGKNTPNGSSSRLLEILSKEPLTLEKLGVYQLQN